MSQGGGLADRGGEGRETETQTIARAQSSKCAVIELLEICIKDSEEHSMDYLMVAVEEYLKPLSIKFRNLPKMELYIMERKSDSTEM